MYYYTTIIDEQGLADVIADTEARINGGFRKGAPFMITATEVPLDPDLPQVAVTWFHLSATGDMEIKNDRQAGAFCAALADGLEEVRRLNDGNYVVIRPPRRGGH